MPGNAPAILAVNTKHFYDDSKTFNLVFWALLVADVDPCLPGQPATSKKSEKGEENIARIANAVQVTICLLVPTSVY